MNGKDVRPAQVSYTTGTPAVFAANVTIVVLAVEAAVDSFIPSIDNFNLFKKSLVVFSYVAWNIVRKFESNSKLRLVRKPFWLHEQTRKQGIVTKKLKKLVIYAGRLEVLVDILSYDVEPMKCLDSEEF